MTSLQDWRVRACHPLALNTGRAPLDTVPAELVYSICPLVCQKISSGNYSSVNYIFIARNKLNIHLSGPKALKPQKRKVSHQNQLLKMKSAPL